MAKPDHEKTAAEARKDLERIGDQSEVIGTSSFARTANRARDHFGGADAPEDDPAELWGRRVGRGLSVIFVIFLVWWLVKTYF
jgi:hypothetical protein